MTAPARRSGPRRILHGIAVGLALLLALYLVGRAVVEVVSVDPARPQTYRADWGGPHYLGVVLVHAGPGLLVLVLAAVLVTRRRARRAPHGTGREDR